MMWTPVIGAVALALVSGCSPTAERPLTPPAIAIPSPSLEVPVAIPAEAEAAVSAALRLVGAGATLVSVEAVEWNDASLGCPQPGMMYAQVITPGYLVKVLVDGQPREVHTDGRGRAALC
jgi:hypothetical protein